MVRLYVHNNEESRETHIVHNGFVLYRNSSDEVSRSRDPNTLEDLFCYIAQIGWEKIPGKMKLKLNPRKLEEEGIIMLDLHGEEIMRATEFFRDSPDVACRMGEHYYEALVNNISEALEHRRRK